MKSTHIYILSCTVNAEKLMKIGVTNNLERRVKSLQTGNPNLIEVEYVEERLNPTKAERYLHRKFSKNKVKGEWFKNLTVRDIREKLVMFLDQD